MSWALLNEDINHQLTKENTVTTAYRANYRNKVITVTTSNNHPGRPWAYVNQYGRTVYLRAEWIKIIGEANAEETTDAAEAEAKYENYARKRANEAWLRGDHTQLAADIAHRANALFTGHQHDTNAYQAADELISRSIMSIPEQPTSLLDEVDQVIREHTTFAKAA